MMDDIVEKKKEPRGLQGGIYTEDSGLLPPQEPDAGILKPSGKKTVRKAGGGVTRADGCITKGHTRGKMISMGG